jgi:8-oxo-dGTP diphosphatase
VVVRRPPDGDPEVLLVHRPKYDDWSFPKGKVDPGEHVTAAAVREVAEETGLEIRLGPPLPDQRYAVEGGRCKRVSYWAGHVVGDDDVSSYRVNAEIDEVAWVPVAAARARLDYARDRALLDEAEPLSVESVPLVVLRHGRARARKTWSGDDRLRPLTGEGEVQAEQLVPVLGAFGVGHVLSSSSRRCWATVAPFARATGVELEDTDDLSQEDATGALVAGQVQALLARAEPAVLCTHRPVLPWVFEALGLEPVALPPAGLCVVHHRRGRVVAWDRHEPQPSVEAPAAAPPLGPPPAGEGTLSR